MNGCKCSKVSFIHKYKLKIPKILEIIQEGVLVSSYCFKLPVHSLFPRKCSDFFLLPIVDKSTLPASKCQLNETKENVDFGLLSKIIFQLIKFSFLFRPPSPHRVTP